MDYVISDRQYKEYQLLKKVAYSLHNRSVKPGVRSDQLKIVRICGMYGDEKEIYLSELIEEVARAV